MANSSVEAAVTFTDPSGQSTSAYWNSFFQSLGGKSEFEWYTSPNEICRILTQLDEFNIKELNESSSSTTLMIHPGSGNSLLPIFLRDLFPSSHHVVLDCSDVALKEMINNHDKDRERVDYMVGDVLKKLPFSSNKFDMWLDKGLIDALFDDSKECNLKKCRDLFQEAHRILKKNCGVVMVTTLAQDHSLELIMDSVLELKLWKHVLLYEVDPLPGSTSTLRPFVFLFVVRDKSEPCSSSIIIRKRNGDELSIILPTVPCKKVDCLTEYLEKSRQEFATEVFKNQLLQSQSSAFKRKSTKVTLEIKPYCAETDLEQLKSNLCSYTDDFPSLEWIDFAIVPIGFGISKLIATCIVSSENENDEIETLCETIQEKEEDVQSVDIESIVYV